jgi:hypothetical protein
MILAVDTKQYKKVGFLQGKYNMDIRTRRTVRSVCLLLTTHSQLTTRINTQSQLATTQRSKLVVSLIAERDEMDGRAPTIIVLTLAAGALGGPDALRALLDLAERSPLVDIAICLLVTAMVTAQLLGVALLTRFVRKPRARAQPRWARGWEV